MAEFRLDLLRAADNAQLNSGYFIAVDGDEACDFAPDWLNELIEEAGADPGSEALYGDLWLDEGGNATYVATISLTDSPGGS
ncbi:hypothetical protein ACQP2T_13490 [Nonomuraea sp. CA-143628]|uniref:hypothetical protein n=1 Tax=Nonomuraea sp. CA-143628 TaxID=3239997 RepID=UPI003D8F3D34